MAIFWRIFIKTIALFFSISFILILVFLLFIFAEDKKDNFFFVSGAENSKNIIPIIELSGLIINDDIKLSNFTLPFIR